MNIKQNLPLVIGLAIPVVLVVALAAIIYVPRLYLKPTVDFVYAVGSYPTYINNAENTRTEYRLVNGRLTKTVSPYTAEKPYYDTESPPEFYRYAVAENKNTPLTEQEITQLNLDPSVEAPDGFKVNNAYSRDNIFEAVFGGRDSSQQVLEKGSVAVKINLVSDADRYSYDFDFIGWVEEAKNP